MNDQTIINFCHLLRRGGMRIAMSEITDAIRAVAHFGVEDGQRFYELLSASLCKDESDRQSFDTAYRLYFGGGDPVMPALFEEKDGCSGDDGSGLTGRGGLTEAASSFLGALARRDTAALDALAEDALAELTVGSSEDMLHELKVKLGWFMAENAIARDREVYAAEATAMQKLEKHLRHRIERQLAKAGRGDELLCERDLAHKELTALSEQEVAAMEQRVARLGNKLAARYSYRLRPAKHGVIHMRKLLADTARRGYPPAKMQYLDKVRDRPSLVVLCDISGSVAVYSSFLLQLVYAMSRRFRDLRCFLFVDDISEVTLALQEQSVTAAVKGALAESYAHRTGVSKQHCSRTGISDYGRVFTIFRRDYLPQLDGQTTLVVLGDARNNWFAGQKEQFAQIAGAARRVLWLNPEPASSWDTGDSIMREYAPYCDRVFPCGNLRELETAVRAIQ